jgi:hypothetical protein
MVGVGYRFEEGSVASSIADHQAEIEHTGPADEVPKGGRVAASFPVVQRGNRYVQAFSKIASATETATPTPRQGEDIDKVGQVRLGCPAMINYDVGSIRLLSQRA